MKILFTAVAVFSICSAAIADMKIVQKIKSSAVMGQPAKDSMVTMYVKGSRMRIENQDQPAYQIIDISEGKAFLIDPTKKEIMVMTTDQMKQAAGMMTALMGGKEGKPKVEKVGTTKTLNGHKCEEYKVTMTAPIAGTSVACIATDIDTAELQPFKSFSESFAQIFGNASDVQGLPVHSESTLNLMGQNITTSSDLVSVSRDKVDDAHFVVPADFKVREMTMPKKN